MTRLCVEKPPSQVTGVYLVALETHSQSSGGIISNMDFDIPAATGLSVTEAQGSVPMGVS